MTLPALPRIALLFGTAVLLGGTAISVQAQGYGRSQSRGAPQHEQRGKQEKKENAYPHATRVEPKDTDLGAAGKKIQKAFDLIEDDKLDEADKVLDEVLSGGKLTPYAKALALHTKGQVKWQKDEGPAAIENIKQAIALDTMPNANQLPAMFQLAQLYVIEEKYAEANAALDAYVKASGDDSAKVLALKGNTFYRTEKFQDAVDTMKQAIAKSDKPEDSWRQILMASLFELEQFDEAAKIAQEDLAKDPTNKKKIQQLASIYINAKQEPKALALLSEAKNKGLFSTEDDYKLLAQLYGQADRPKEGAALLEEGFQKGAIKPSYAMYKLLGDSYALGDDDAKAIEAYTKASPLATDGEADFQRGQLLINSERYAEAKTALTQALTRGVKRQGATHVLLGNALNELGDKQGAIAEMEKARSYEETRAMAETWLKSLRSGAVIKTQKQKPQAPKQK